MAGNSGVEEAPLSESVDAGGAAAVVLGLAGGVEAGGGRCGLWQRADQGARQSQHGVVVGHPCVARRGGRTRVACQRPAAELRTRSSAGRSPALSVRHARAACWLALRRPLQQVRSMSPTEATSTR
jgi:hypothetical protein